MAVDMCGGWLWGWLFLGIVLDLGGCRTLPHLQASGVVLAALVGCLALVDCFVALRERFALLAWSHASHACRCLCSCVCPCSLEMASVKQALLACFGCLPCLFFKSCRG